MIDKFARAFIRTGQGSWLCRNLVHINGPYGPASTTPGVTYETGKKLLGAYDVAAWLDDFHASGKTPVGVNFL